MKRNKALLITVMIFLLNQGCSTPLTDNAQASKNSQCPDLSGYYEAQVKYMQKGKYSYDNEPSSEEKKMGLMQLC